MADQLVFNVTEQGTQQVVGLLERLLAAQNAVIGAQRSGVAASQQATQATQAWGAAFQQAEANLKRVAGAWADTIPHAQRATTAFKTAGDEVARSGNSARNAGMAWVSLGGVLGGLPGPLGSVAGAFGSISVMTTRVNADTLALATGLVSVGSMLAGAFVDTVQEARQFERTFAEVKIVTQATAEEMGQLTQAAINLGQTSQFTSQQVAKGFYELGSAGFTAGESLRAITPITQAAMIGNLELGKTAQATVGILRQFNLDTDRTAHVVDVLTTAVQGSVLHWNDVLNIVSNLRGRATQLNVTFEESAAVLMLMSNAGVPATAASTALGTALDRLSKHNGEAAKGLAELGVNAYDSSGKFVGLTDVLVQIERRLPHMTEEQANHALAMLGGSRAAGVFTQTLQQQQRVHTANGEEVLRGTELLKYWTEQLQHSDGATQAAADVISQTLDAQLKNLHGSIQEAGIRVGTVFIPEIKAATGVLRDLTNGFVAAPPAAQAAVAAFLAVGSVAATATGLVLGFNVANVAMGGALVAALTGALPVVAVIGALALAVGALAVAWSQDWGNIQENTAAAATVIGSATSQTLTTLGDEKNYLDTVLIPAWQRYWAEKNRQAPAPTEGSLAPNAGDRALSGNPLQPGGGAPSATAPHISDMFAPGTFENMGRDVRRMIEHGLVQSGDMPGGSILYGLLNPQGAASAVDAVGRAMRPEWEKLTDDIRLAGANSAAAYAEGWQGPTIPTSLDQVEARIKARLDILADQGRAGGTELVDSFKQGFIAQSPELAEALDTTISQAARRIQTTLNGMGEETGAPFVERIYEQALARIQALFPNLPPEILGIFRAAIQEQVGGFQAAGNTAGEAVATGVQKGAASTPERVAAILEETAKVVRDKEGNIKSTSQDFGAAIALAISEGDAAAARSLTELQRATNFFHQELSRLTPEWAVYAQQIAAASGPQAALDALVKAGVVSLEAYQAAITGAATAHQAAAGATAARTQAAHTHAAATDHETSALSKAAQTSETTRKSYTDLAASATQAAQQTASAAESALNKLRSIQAAASKLRPGESVSPDNALANVDVYGLYVNAMNAQNQAQEAARRAEIAQYEAAHGLGIATVRGMTDGITSSQGMVNQAVQNMAQGTVDTAQNTLGIHSPSVVFAEEVGTPAAEGFLVGLQQTVQERLPGIWQTVIASATDRIANGLPAQALQGPWTNLGEDAVRYLATGFERQMQASQARFASIVGRMLPTDELAAVAEQAMANAVQGVVDRTSIRIAQIAHGEDVRAQMLLAGEREAPITNSGVDLSAPFQNYFRGIGFMRGDQTAQGTAANAWQLAAQTFGTPQYNLMQTWMQQSAAETAAASEASKYPNGQPAPGGMTPEETALVMAAYNPSANYQNIPIFGTQEGVKTAAEAIAGASQAAERANQVGKESGQIFQQVGSGLVRFTANWRNLNLTAAGWQMLIDQRAVDFLHIQQQMQQQTVQNLRAGTTTIAGVTTQAGLTYPQIYGGTTATTTATGFQPGSMYGLPIVSPITPGTLRGFDSGTMVYRPTYLTDAATMQTWGVMAEKRPEAIGGAGPGGGDLHVHLHFDGTVIGSDFRDRRVVDPIATAVAARLQNRGMPLWRTS